MQTTSSNSSGEVGTASQSGDGELQLGLNLRFQYVSRMLSETRMQLINIHSTPNFGEH